jgi:hypothetical protein
MKSLPFAYEVMSKKEPLSRIDLDDPMGDWVAVFPRPILPFLHDSAERFALCVVSKEIFSSQLDPFYVNKITEIGFWLVQPPLDSPKHGWGGVDTGNRDDWWG